MSSGTYEGTFEVDGAVHGSTVDWFVPGNMEACLSSGRHRVVLKPLGPAMFRPRYGDVGPRIVLPQGDVAPPSRHWTINASRVGGYSHGPLGHPGDGKYDYWPISHFRLETIYAADHLRAALTLTTDLGRSAFPARQPGPLPVKKILICFSVQHAQMAAFFGLTSDSQLTELNRRLEQMR